MKAPSRPELGLTRSILAMKPARALLLRCMLLVMTVGAVLAGSPAAQAAPFVRPKLGAAWQTVDCKSFDVPAAVTRLRDKLDDCYLGPSTAAIVAAATETNPAFSASYDLVTDDTGATKRLSLTLTLAERDRQMSIARDEENMWLITDHEGDSREAYEGAMDVDMVLSPFFNALPIRRAGLHRTTETVTLPLVYVYLPDLTIEAAEITYTGLGGGAIKLHSPVAETTIVVDDDGFIVKDDEVEGMEGLVAGLEEEDEEGEEEVGGSGGSEEKKAGGSGEEAGGDKKKKTRSWFRFGGE
jgi:hypothetical protein